MTSYMMFECRFTLWPGGEYEEESVDYVYRQVALSLADFTMSFERHLSKEFKTSGIARTMQITNEGCC